MLLKTALVATLLGLVLLVGLIFAGGQISSITPLVGGPYPATPYPTRDP